jgi:hypothetical protein
VHFTFPNQNRAYPPRLARSETGSSGLGLEVLEPALSVHNEVAKSAFRFATTQFGDVPGRVTSIVGRGREGGLEGFGDGQRGSERGGLAIDLRTGCTGFLGKEEGL